MELNPDNKVQEIAIVCDNYKVSMFLDEFKRANIEVIETKPMGKIATIIVCRSQQILVKPIVDKITQYFYNTLNKP
jgi:uncharacterized protein involved in propanediol utilization